MSGEALPSPFDFAKEERRMTNTVDIYFRDLTPDAQKQVLEAAGITDARETNWDVLPMVTMDFGVEAIQHTEEKQYEE